MKKSYVYLLTTFMLWGSLYVVSQFVLGKIPTFTVAMFRYLIAFIALSLISLKSEKEKIEKSDYKYLFDTVGSLCSVLAIKAELGVKIKAAYDNRELETLKKISSEILPELITRLNTFRDNLETQWLYENKPFGFEIQDIRIGGLLRRLETARERITAYVNGSVKSLPELEGERLPYGNSNSGEVIFMNKWISTISAGKYQG